MSVFTEKLVELVKNYPILYDLGHTDYKNIRKRDKIWDEIGLEMNESGPEVKKRWKNLRDTYAKYLKSTKTKTGQAAKKNYSKWQWATIMETFKPYMAFAKTDSNVSQLEEKDDNQTANTSQSIQLSDSAVDSDIDDPVPQSEASRNNNWVNTDVQAPVINTEPQLRSSRPFLSVSKGRKGNKRDTKTEKKSISSVDSVLEYFRTKKQKTDFTPIEMIFLGYAHTIQTFSPRIQAITKGKIAQIIMEQELLNQELSTADSQIHSRPSSSASSYSNVPMASPAYSQTDIRPSSSVTSYVNVPMNSPLEIIDYQESSMQSGSSSSNNYMSMNMISPSESLDTTVKLQYDSSLNHR